MSADYDVEVAMTILLSAADAPPPVPADANASTRASDTVNGSTHSTNKAGASAHKKTPAKQTPSKPAAAASKSKSEAKKATQKETPKQAVKKGLVTPAADSRSNSVPGSRDASPTRTVQQSVPLADMRAPPVSVVKDSAAMDAAIAEDDEGKEYVPTVPTATTTGSVDQIQTAGSRKESLSMVVVGHVDAGKSTLMGQLIVKIRAYSAHKMQQYEKRAREEHKQSFYLAWLMDTSSTERSRGVTIEVAQKFIETQHKAITLLDAPGHRHVRNVIQPSSRTQ